jgi:hypothetical protein
LSEKKPSQDGFFFGYGFFHSEKNPTFASHVNQPNSEIKPAHDANISALNIYVPIIGYVVGSSLRNTMRMQ